MALQHVFSRLALCSLLSIFDRRCIKLLKADHAREEHPLDAVESWGHMQEWAKLQPARLRLAELQRCPLWRAALWTLPCVWYLRIAVEDKDVSCAVVFQVGDLQAAGVADFSRLEGGIEGLNFHHRFGVSGLHTRVRGSFVAEVSFQTSSIYVISFDLRPVCWSISTLPPSPTGWTFGLRTDHCLVLVSIETPLDILGGRQRERNERAFVCVCAIKASLDKARN